MSTQREEIEECMRHTTSAKSRLFWGMFPELSEYERDELIDAFRAETLQEASDAIQEARNGFLNDDVSFGMAVARTVLRRMAGKPE